MKCTLMIGVGSCITVRRLDESKKTFEDPFAMSAYLRQAMERQDTEANKTLFFLQRVRCHVD